MYNCKEKQDTNNNSGVPTGTIINFFGDTAPEGYLSCDGTEYLKSDYPLLATHLASLTTASLYIGSDEDHFKVPDLRGEFLRGGGTNGHTGQGSGDNVGVHQDGTETTNLAVNANNGAEMAFLNLPDGQNADYKPKNADSPNNKTRKGIISLTNYTARTDHDNVIIEYTSRPTNTSVLYCIKY